MTFPLAKKGDVNGPNAQPTFEFLKEKTPRFFGLYSNITWNYEKVRSMKRELCLANCLGQFVRRKWLT